MCPSTEGIKLETFAASRDYTHLTHQLNKPKQYHNNTKQPHSFIFGSTIRQHNPHIWDNLLMRQGPLNPKHCLPP